MRLKHALTWFLRLFKAKRKEIRPSIEELTRAREIMKKISISQEADIVERSTKLKKIVEGRLNGERKE